jgi:hypothetical protein
MNPLFGKLSLWIRNPLLQIFILGLITWLAYLDLALTYPLKKMVDQFPLTDFARANGWSQSSLFDFLISIFGAFVLYVIAWRIVRSHPRDRRLLWLIFSFAVLFALTFLMMYPITATDVFEYVFHSRILVHYGQNPLAVPPNAFPNDPFLKTVNWARHPSPYGPLWVLLTVPGSLIAGDDLILNLTLMGTLAVVFFLGCALMIAAVLRCLNPGYQVIGTLLFAWNPLVLFEAAGNAHNGIIMMFFALCAIYFLVRRQWLWVIPALVASVFIKYITAILLLPFLFYCWRAQADKRQRWSYFIKTSVVTAIFSALIILPFLQVPAGLLEEGNFYSLLALPTLIYNLLLGIHGDKVAKIITIIVCVLAYLILYVISLRAKRGQNPQELIVLSTWLIVAYLGIACMHFQPWFAIWPIALGIWVDHPLVRRVLVVFTASALLAYVANYYWIWNYRVMQKFEVNLMFTLVIFSPPLIVGLISRARALSWAYAERLRMLTRA